MPVLIDGPDTPHGSDREPVLQRDSERLESLTALPIEPHRRLRIGVSFTAFAGLVSLDPGGVEYINVWGNARVQRRKPIFPAGTVLLSDAPCNFWL